MNFGAREEVTKDHAVYTEAENTTQRCEASFKLHASRVASQCLWVIEHPLTCTLDATSDARSENTACTGPYPAAPR